VKRIALLIAFLLCAQSALAQTYDVPGNDIDEDAAGGDAAGLANDDDLDGYTTDGTHLGKDCDDTNPLIIQGTEVTSGCSAGQWKTCQSDGTYSACGNACPSGTCYHVDPVSGNNVNAGTSYAAAFADWSCLSSYASGAPACNVHGSLACGDHIYLHPGTHSNSHTESGYNKVGLLIKNKACPANNLITVHAIGAAVLDLPSTATDESSAIFVDNSDGVFLKLNHLGEVTGNVSTGSASGQEMGAISCRDSDDFTVQGGYFHDNSGDGNTNPAAIRIGTCTRWVVDHVKAYNQINNSGNSDNNCLVIAFNGSGTIKYSMLGYTATPICGVRYKHGASAGSFSFHHNRLSRAQVISAAPGEVVENNIFANSATGGGQTCGVDTYVGIGMCDNGGPAYDGTQVVRYNSFLGGHAYAWNPENDWDAGGASSADSGTFGTLSFTYNVVVDPDTFFSRTDSLGNIDNYGTDADYASIVTGGKMTESYNCYHDSGSTGQWSWYGQTTNPAGDYFTFADPDPTGFCAAGCFDENPTVDTQLRATATNCLNYGWQANWTADGSASPSTPTTTGAAHLINHVLWRHNRR
jgi:hypothetical protein